MTSTRPVASVIGSAHASPELQAHAEELGRLLMDAGFVVMTGGLGGVMEAASRGARQSSHHREGRVVGVLPTYDRTTANPHVDLALCTGMNHARNVIIVGSATVVLAIGGRAGTLSEIALAWCLGKPIIAVGSEGWADELAGRTLDHRRTEPIHGPHDPASAVALALELAAQDRPGPARF